MNRSSSDQPTGAGKPLVRWPVILTLGLVIGGPGPPAIAQSASPPPAQARDGFGVASEWAGFVDRTRSRLPEGPAMLVEILAGGQLVPGRGWFEKGISQARFSWESVAARLDRDQDGSIDREEFLGPDRDFRRLDRDRSGKLTRVDFEFPKNALYRSRSRMLLSFADRNKDGRLVGDEYAQMIFMGVRDGYTRIRFFSDAVEEVEAVYKESERLGVPFLGLGDLRDTVDMAAVRKGLEQVPDPDGDLEKTSRSTLLNAFIRREIGSMYEGPALGELSPGFTLPTDDGKGQVTLANLLGTRPVVLVFGSLTDATLRSDAGSLEKLYRIYRDRAEFLMIYVRESRPSDGWASEANAKLGIKIPQPTDDRGRLRVAGDLRRKLGLTWPMVVDRMDDRVGILYSGLPDRIYLLDRRGRVAYKGGRGPLGFKPDELEQSLILLDQAEPSLAPKPAGR